MALYIEPSIIVTAFTATCAIFACFTLAALYAPDRKYLYLGGLPSLFCFTLLKSPGEDSAPLPLNDICSFFRNAHVVSEHHVLAGPRQPVFPQSDGVPGQFACATAFITICVVCVLLVVNISYLYSGSGSGQRYSCTKWISLICS